MGWESQIHKHAHCTIVREKAAFEILYARIPSSIVASVPKADGLYIIFDINKGMGA